MTITALGPRTVAGDAEAVARLSGALCFRRRHNREETGVFGVKPVRYIRR